MCLQESGQGVSVVAYKVRPIMFCLLYLATSKVIIWADAGKCHGIFMLLNLGVLASRVKQMWSP